MSDLPKKLEAPSKKTAESNKVTPIRFDSAPTRVRFDSAPTRVRLEYKDKINSNAKSNQLKMSNEKKTCTNESKTDMKNPPSSSKLGSETEKIKTPQHDESKSRIECRKNEDAKKEKSAAVTQAISTENKDMTTTNVPQIKEKTNVLISDAKENSNVTEKATSVKKSKDEDVQSPPATVGKINDDEKLEITPDSRKTGDEVEVTGNMKNDDKEILSVEPKKTEEEKTKNVAEKESDELGMKIVDVISLQKKECSPNVDDTKKSVDEREIVNESEEKVKSKEVLRCDDQVQEDSKCEKEKSVVPQSKNEQNVVVVTETEKGKNEVVVTETEKAKNEVVETEKAADSFETNATSTEKSDESEKIASADKQMDSSMDSSSSGKDGCSVAAKRRDDLIATIKKLEGRVKSLSGSEEPEDECESEVEEGSDEETKEVESGDKLDDIGDSVDEDLDQPSDSNESEKSEKTLGDEKSGDVSESDKTDKMDVDEENENLIEMEKDDSNLLFEISDVRTVQSMDDTSENGTKSNDADNELQPTDEVRLALDKIVDDVEAAEKKVKEQTVVVVKPAPQIAFTKSIIKVEKEEPVEARVVEKPKLPQVKLRTSERLCTECNRIKACKYQVLMHGTTRYLCDDNCYKSFRDRHKPIGLTERPVTRSLTQPKDFCSICRKEIKNGLGFLTGVGENKPLCSEDCMRKYHTVNAPKRGCAQCGNAIQGRYKCLTWETMEFCNEDCLGKYQSFLGSHCAKCKNSVQRISLGKYCVRFGSDIKQFCSNNCLDEFKKTLCVCSFCQKDIAGREQLTARIGDKGLLKDFCSKVCMEKYDAMNQKKSQPNVHQCSVCNKIVPIKVQVVFEGKSHRLCSEPCIAAFRYANKISTSICDSCHKFFDVDNAQPHTIQFEGLSKRFCAKTCMNVFVMSHRKIVPCTWCKVKKYNFDMIERVDSNNHVQLFCSLNCLSLFRVSLNATSSKSIRCDQCHNTHPAQYHLTMSDASIRNFCCYQCVVNFQSQFTNVAPVTSKIVNTSIPIPPTTSVVTTTVPQSIQVSSGTPIISSVRSLAGQSQPVFVVPSRQQTVTSIIAPTLTTTNTITKPTTVATASVGTASSQPVIQVLIKPPPPKQMKNKSLMCRPFMQTKGVSCKPHPCHKTIQTEPEEVKVVNKPVLIPVPVPIFVPVPMHMWVKPVPHPVPFPIPVPVPIFIPTSKNTVEEISKQIKEIQEKIPNNPFEAELLMMAEMVANNNKSGNNKSSSNVSTSTSAGTSNGEQGQISSDAEQSEQFGMETQMADGMHATNAFSDDMLQMALRMATEMDEPALDVESALGPGGHQSSHDTAFNSIEENNSDVLSPRELRARTRGQKRTGGSHKGRGRKKLRTDENSLQMTPAGVVTPADSNSILKYTYGVNAWKHWVLEKNTQLEKASQNNRKLKLFKTDLLQLTADELNYSLCLFVKEVRKPNREEYASDSIFYLCLGIQQYLFDNGRIDNIFTDAYYEKFTECLNEVLQKGETAAGIDGVFASRIEEEMLWEAKQLGAHSPHVLLNTLMYFNTKSFYLRTVEDHMRLSFSHILKHWKKSGSLSPAKATNQSNAGRNILLRYCPPSHQKSEGGRKRKDDQPVMEQTENLDNPLRCPVKLYEFYLSKCPESIRNRSDVFYLYPERSCVPDSPVWYSTMPLGKEAIAKMLQRIKNVREVSDVF